MSRRDSLPGSIPQVKDRYVLHDLGHVIAILHLLENPRYYAEHTVARYVKEHPRLGSSDRALIGGLVFALVRWRRRIDEAIDRTPGGQAALGQDRSLRILMACGVLLRVAGYAPEAVLSGIMAQTAAPIDERVFAGWLDRAAGTALSLDPSEAASPSELALRTSFPDWIIERWVHEYGWERARAIAVASRSRAPVALRVNTLRAGRTEVMDALSREGIRANATSLSPWGILLEEPVRLVESPLYREGKVEFQDEGSQLVALVSGAKSGMRVVDACAGGGGKTLALAAMMEDQGELLALDTNAGKLAELRKRAHRAGVHIVTTARAEDDAAYGSPTGTADIVLVDAPCSGSGTWRRMPDGPAHLTPNELVRLARAQREVLTRCGPLVRTRGRLIYATCSLFREENEQVVERWLRENPAFHTLDLRTWLPRHLADTLVESSYLALAPDRHGTDGFFAAVMERITTTA